MSVVPVARMGSGDHLCLPYSAEAEQREVITAYVREGLSRNEKVFYVSDTASPAQVYDMLAQAGLDVHRAVWSGQLTARPADETYLPGGRFNPQDAIDSWFTLIAESVRSGFAGVRLAREMSWALRGAPGSQWIGQYEIEVRHVFDTGLALGLCLYDQRLFDPHTLADLCSRHPGKAAPDPLYQHPQLRILRWFDPPGLRLIGSVDLATVPGLAEALRRAAQTPGDIHLDVTEMEFIDVAGMRAIVTGARSLARGRRLIVHGLAPMMQRVVKLAGWADVPGLVFITPPGAPDAQGPETRR